MTGTGGEAECPGPAERGQRNFTSVRKCVCRPSEFLKEAEDVGFYWKVLHFKELLLIEM